MAIDGIVDLNLPQYAPSHPIIGKGAVIENTISSDIRAVNRQYNNPA
jgi:hypothetical protein